MGPEGTLIPKKAILIDSNGSFDVFYYQLIINTFLPEKVTLLQ